MSQAMNEKTIWDFLMKQTGNAYGVAAIMGNLMAESSLNPLCATGKNKTPDYALDADSGKVDFVHDGVAFGLVQWCYHTRKEGLINYACKQGTSVGNLNTQLEYLWKEMIGYKTVWNAVLTGTNIREISDIVMLKYEKPSNTSEAAKQKRANYAKAFYNQFADGGKKDQQGNQKMVIAKDDVRIRAGNSKDYGQVGKLKKGQSAIWVTTVGGWHAVAMKDRVGWVSGDFSEVKG